MRILALFFVFMQVMAKLVHAHIGKMQLICIDYLHLGYITGSGCAILAEE